VERIGLFKILKKLQNEHEAKASSLILNGILKLYEKVTKYDATTKLKLTNLKTRSGFHRHMKNV